MSPARRAAKPAADDRPLQYLTIDEVADLVRLSRDSIERLIAAGELPAIDVRVTGKRAQLRVPADAAREFQLRRAV